MFVEGENHRIIEKKQGKFIPVLLISLCSAVVLSVIVILISRYVGYKIKNSPSITKLENQWKEGDYLGVYDTSSILIEKKFLNNTVLTYRGYAAYRLSCSEIDPSLAQKYVNEAIRSLRIAIMDAKPQTLPQIYYQLGRAYFHKNTICSYHYYSDLVVKYLELARSLGYNADDIPELLGISYGNLGNSIESIKSFSEALNVRESDSPLLMIAEQYYKEGQYPAAKQYLYQVSSRANDDSLMLKSQTILGKIYLEEEDYENAKIQYEAILEKDENSPDAHYGLGVIYEKNNDMVKARAEWRKTLKIDGNYEPALKKMYP